jgi:hypothetical protein
MKLQDLDYTRRLALTEPEMQALVHAFAHGRQDLQGRGFSTEEALALLDWANHIKVQWQVMQCIFEGFGMLDADSQGNIKVALSIGSKEALERNTGGKRYWEPIIQPSPH